MMRLLIPLTLVLLGGLIGYLAKMISGKPGQPVMMYVVGGALGGFGGLIARDLLDIEWGGDLGGSLVAVLLGAGLLSLLLGLVSR